MSDLTVWCVNVGDKYSPSYVYALKEMVERHLTIPHRFRCITTHHLPGINTVNPFVPYQGWWSKFSLFAPMVATGPSIYFDLDVIITGNIDYLADYTDTFSAPPNWAASGHGGIQSSIMCWPGNWNYFYDEIRKVWPGKTTEDGYKIFHGDKFNGEKIWGDQEFFWHLLKDDWRRINKGIYSYKYHVRNNGKLPKDSRIIVFHGPPKPHEINEPWMSQSIYQKPSAIKQNISCG